MSSATNNVENSLVDFLFRAQAYSPDATAYFALFTSATDDAGGGTEVTGGSYARVALAYSATNFTNTQNSGTGASTGTGGATSNAVTINFPLATADWGTITHWAIMSASSAGSMRFHGALSASRIISTGGQASFPPGSFTMTVA